jgi:hypothetical protein
MLKDNPKVVLDAQEKALSKATTDARTLSTDIRLLQHVSGWTVREMADFYDIPFTTLEDWRKGKCPKNLKLMYSIRYSVENISSSRRH